ncbi:hypothetical protein EHQ53_14955 [Leptospira langatensis]|uniref:Porin family protein n=1 Tax=Leptospira langatensis TaxID=2484983 RepID=A0A5F1ZS52_9LEPT|nr:hypothetical protein [Leptospira langatensis]TGK01775.1 hypothetical protein EHO57_08195 [Leptospira langatensis]TGL39381.1 hypothetical protein EHQ53_14955 [Leptospira langatensis]
MKMKRLVLGLAICFPVLPAVAQNKSSDMQTKQNTAWTLKLGAGRGEVRDGSYSYGTSSAYRMSAEYNPRYFGLELGITQGNYSIKKEESLDKSSALAYSNGNGGNYIAYRNFDRGIDKGEFFRLNYVDIGPTLHFRPGKTIDPYASIGIGIADRGSYRAYSRLGLRVNMDRAFVYFEGEASNINRNYVDRHWTYHDYNGWVGVGMYLGSMEPSTDADPSTGRKPVQSEPFAFR